MTAVAPDRRLRLRMPHGLGRWVRPLLLAAAAVATIVALALYVFPTRTWLDQKAALQQTQADLNELQAERASLEARIAELDTDAEIERIARSQFGLVLPGEEAYAVLPAPEKPIELPSLWPFGEMLAPVTADAPPSSP